jgi:murein DD-endopeptidase MepM/ murein hydrolase activator NlpD
MSRKNKQVEKALLATIGGSALPVIGTMVVIILVVVVILAAAGGILGWLWGGGSPTETGNSQSTPSGEVHFWTPTPIPAPCFVTPTAVAVINTPVPVATAGPGETPQPTNTSSIAYLPTPTACPPPRETWPTPDPRYTPLPEGFGPHGSPFRAGYIVTQPFGCTDFPEFKDQACASSTGGAKPWFHRGYDMVSQGDKTIYATIDGQCIFAGFQNDGFGNRVYVKSGQFLVIYPHMSRVIAVTGAPIKWGQPIGTEGSTGYSTGEHLHYEIHINGAWVNPVPYLER